jgi:beta-glucosidase
MPWRDDVSAILEAWYPGARGGEAIADILFGGVNPSGRLPLTFPADAAQLPRVEVPGRRTGWSGIFPVAYAEGAAIGYKWFDAKNLPPLYSFGFGLSYTHFRYGELRVVKAEPLTVSFSVTNDGKRRGADTPQLYARIPGAADGATTRLVGWKKVELAPGETARVTLAIDPRLLAHFDEAAQGWRIDAGKLRVTLAASARDPRLATTTQVRARILPP